MNEEQNMHNDYEPYYEPQQSEGKTPNILCAISLACEILPTVISGITISALYNVMDENASSLSDIVTNILGIFDFILMAAGLILMIYVRIKYPKNVFGKVLMWLYIASAIIMVLLVIAYALIAFIACMSCISCIQDLG